LAQARTDHRLEEFKGVVVNLHNRLVVCEGVRDGWVKLGGSFWARVKWLVTGRV
jgi:hypothetical protein